MHLQYSGLLVSGQVQGPIFDKAELYPRSYVSALEVLRSGRHNLHTIYNHCFSNPT